MAGSGTAHLREGDALLRAEHLTVEFPVGRTGLKVHAVSDVSIDVRKGETLGLVGESGCGKSTTGKALLQFPPPTAGSVDFEGTELTELKSEDLRQVRTRMQMIFQDPISALNPRRTVGQIVTEPLSIWSTPRNEDRSPTTTIAAGLGLALSAVLAVAGAVYFVLGVLAMFGIGDDRLGVEPLAADVTTGGGFKAAFVGVGFMMVGAAVYGVARNAWRRAAGARSSLIGTLLVLAFAGLVGFWLVDMPIGYAAVLFLVALIAGVLLNLKPSQQDFPDVGEDGVAMAKQVLHDVGLDPEVAWGKRPHEFSGGQCQRISIARALVLDPKLIICDEPVSALDVSVQAQILNLLQDTKARYGLTMVFIAHDLAVVKNISDRVAVMYLGKLCEVGAPDELYVRPAHPYTEALLEAIPVPDPQVKPEQDSALSGDLPSPVTPPSGCRFRTRCPVAQELCAQAEPEMRRVREGHYVACHYPLVEID